MATFSRGTVALRPHQRVRLNATAAAGTKQNPFNLHEPLTGAYRVVWASGGSIWFRHSNYSTPPFEHTIEAVTTGDAREPRLAVDYRGRLVLLFTRRISGSDSVYEAVSYDDGLTWSTPALAIANGTHPTIAVGFDGTIIRAAVVSGKITANRQAPGDASPGANFNFKDNLGVDLAVADDSFHITQGFEGPARWLLAVIISGETSPSDWWSSDLGVGDSASWARF